MTGHRVVLHCRDCKYWYGAEDDGAGPCSLKHMRGLKKYMTWGSHVCDEKAALDEKAELERYGSSPK